MKPDTAIKSGDLRGFNNYLARNTQGVYHRFLELFLLESSRWFLWIPVFLGIGIAVYFSLDFEPPVIFPLSLFVISLGIAAIPGKSHVVFPLVMAAVMVSSGFLIAKIRNNNVAAPVLVKRIGPVSITGWLEHIEARPSGGMRLIIRPERIDRIKTGALPKRIQLTARVSVANLKSGDGISLRAILLPPPGPVQPGGFSYARMAWFKQIGATGFLVSRPKKIQTGEHEITALLSAWISRVRARVTSRVIAGLDGPAGAMAAALITGDKGALDPNIRDRMRDAGLAHLLAISGLHMGLFGGVLFMLVRAVLALSAHLTLKYPIKKWSAIIALFGSFSYLLLSGGSIATQRAFIMISIMFLAILLNRRALSMRNVALAAMVVLLARPESLLSVSFQMSFAAVIALIAVYETGLFRISPERLKGKNSWIMMKAALYIFGVLLTSLIASMATAPFAAYHFHRAAFYGVLGNMIAVPLMALLIMPAALCVLIAMPFGLESYPLAVMGFGIELVVSVATYVAALPGAVGFIPRFHPVSLPLFVIGGLWLCLWRQKWRMAGALLIMIALAQAPFTDKAEVMIERQGDNLAIRNQAGQLTFLKSRKGAYSARKWLESDGDARSQRQAANKGEVFSCDSLACIARLRNGVSLAYIKHMAALSEECGRATIIISTLPVWRGSCKGSAYIIDKFDLRSNGATAIFTNGDEIRIRTAAEYEGLRPWSSTGKNKYKIRLP